MKGLDARKRSIFDLPPDIRNAIYRLALHRGKTVILQANRHRRFPGLIRASMHIRCEALHIFCEENNFLVRVKHARLPPREHWIWRLGGDKKAQFYNIGRTLWDDFLDWTLRY